MPRTDSNRTEQPPEPRSDDRSRKRDEEARRTRVGSRPRTDSSPTIRSHSSRSLRRRRSEAPSGPGGGATGGIWPAERRRGSGGETRDQTDDGRPTPGSREGPRGAHPADGNHSRIKPTNQGSAQEHSRRGDGPSKHPRAEHSRGVDGPSKHPRSYEATPASRASSSRPRISFVIGRFMSQKTCASSTSAAAGERSSSSAARASSSRSKPSR